MFRKITKKRFWKFLQSNDNILSNNTTILPNVTEVKDLGIIVDHELNSPFAHGGLFWPGCQICNVSVGSIWYSAKCFNNIVVKSVCYRTVKLWWIYFKMRILYNYFCKPTLCETAAETDSSAGMQRSLGKKVVIEITHGRVACNRLSVERCLANGPLASWFQLPRRLPPCMDILLDMPMDSYILVYRSPWYAHDKTDKECDTCGSPLCKRVSTVLCVEWWSASLGV